MVAEDEIEALNAWLAKAGLRGEAEATLVNGFCERAVAAGVPISRALLLVDTLHPIYEGRLVRWGYDPSQRAVVDYACRKALLIGVYSPSRANTPRAGAQVRSFACWRPETAGCAAV